MYDNNYEGAVLALSLKAAYFLAKDEVNNALRTYCESLEYTCNIYKSHEKSELGGCISVAVANLVNVYHILHFAKCCLVELDDFKKLLMYYCEILYGGENIDYILCDIMDYVNIALPYPSELNEKKLVIKDIKRGIYASGGMFWKNNENNFSWFGKFMQLRLNNIRLSEKSIVSIYDFVETIEGKKLYYLPEDEMPFLYLYSNGGISKETYKFWVMQDIKKNNDDYEEVEEDEDYDESEEEYYEDSYDQEDSEEEYDNEYDEDDEYDEFEDDELEEFDEDDEDSTDDYYTSDSHKPSYDSAYDLDGDNYLDPFEQDLMDRSYSSSYTDNYSFEANDDYFAANDNEFSADYDFFE